MHMYKRSITVIGFCLLLCACFVLSLYGCQNDSGAVGTLDSAGNANLIGNNLDNIHNGGYMAIQDDYMYFYQISPNQGLYRSKIDGNEKIKLLDGITRSINVVGDKIYFIKDEFVKKTTEEIKDLYQYNLYSSNLDGSDETKLIENCGSAFVTSDYIYYTNEVDSIAYKYDGKPVPDNQGYLYRFDLHTSTSEVLIAEAVSEFWVKNDKLYYTGANQDCIFRVLLTNHSSAPSVVYPNSTSKNENVRQFAVRTDDRLVIYDWKSLFLYDESTSNTEILDSDYSEDVFTQTETDIFYMKNLDFIYKLSMDSKKTVEVCAVDYTVDSLPKLYCFGNDCYLFDGVKTPQNITSLIASD